MHTAFACWIFDSVKVRILFFPDYYTTISITSTKYSSTHVLPDQVKLIQYKFKYTQHSFNSLAWIPFSTRLHFCSAQLCQKLPVCWAVQWGRCSVMVPCKDTALIIQHNRESTHNFAITFWMYKQGSPTVTALRELQLGNLCSFLAVISSNMQK